KGYPVIITDTAGIRETDNPIEKQGIEIAKEKIKTADIIINLYDATNSFCDTSLDANKTIFIANKIDKLNEEELNKIPQNHLKISAKYNQGIEDLVENILNIIKNNFANSSNYLITRERYRIALEECLEHLNIFSLDKEIELSAEDIRLACRSIGKITGYVEVEEILDKIFGSFCIGK
ncbi:MAG: tRNA uridine-5-carboxymethylaminomethyl(34) synthesis GTPase MnmE, partial [Alphaproteobacteria bacterium]|nr:tRNA uridine-5-carboxymethylaminomethyl(34) synthesis GTPase MnmE [Alphaproteobacteria bacterium]